MTKELQDMTDEEFRQWAAEIQAAIKEADGSGNEIAARMIRDGAGLAIVRANLLSHGYVPVTWLE